MKPPPVLVECSVRAMDGRDEVLQVDNGGCNLTPHGLGKATIVQEDSCPLNDSLVTVINYTIGLGRIGSSCFMNDAMFSKISSPEGITKFCPLVDSDAEELPPHLAFCHYVVYLECCKSHLAMLVCQE